MGGGRALLVALLLAVASPAAAQGRGADSAGSGSATDEEGQPPSLPALPPAMTLDLIRSGDSLFHGKGACFACHGADATGLPDAGSAITRGLNFVPIEWHPIDSLIAAGIPDPITRSAIEMPPRGGKSNLAPDEVRAIAAYVWAISQTRGEPWPGGHATHASTVPVGSTSGTSTARPAAIDRMDGGDGGGVLGTHGFAGGREAALGWVLLIVASVVTVAVSVLVLVGVLRLRTPEMTPPVRTGGGLRWIAIGGIAVPTVILLAVFVFSMVTHSAVAAPATPPAVTVQVTGHRWWWEVRYLDPSPSRIAVTANEIHIPVGQPVRFELVTGDVIHSFWIPELAGKTDLIPGQTNVMWLEADSAGVYRGQCGEYCGLEHAKMAMSVVAEPPAAFVRWLEHQRRPVAEPTDPDVAAGERVFAGSACSLCHTIRGTSAGGGLGPDLTHVAGRGTIAAGMLPNTRGNLAGWIANPQALKPGSLMPVVPLKSTELLAIVTFLQSLD